MSIHDLSKFLLFLNICLLTQAFTNKIHHSLTQQQLEALFNVNSHAQVPEYDVIRIHSRARRSAQHRAERTVRLRAFGETHTLLLKRNDALARGVPIFFADPQAKGAGVVLTPVKEEGLDVGTPYQDEASRAALMVHHDRDTGDLLLDGTIGDDLVVRPLPRALHSLIPVEEEEEDRRRGNRREDEASENALLEDSLHEDDELFMDQMEDEGDLVFSDGLPLVPDDEDQHAGLGTGEGRAEKTWRNATTEGSKEGANRTLPEGLLLLKKRRRRRRKRGAEGLASSQGLHVVFRREATPLDTDYAMMELDKVPLRAPEARPRRTKREAPYVIYPEILVLVDYDGYLLHGQDNSKIKSYYVSFWNGVDLRYKLLSNPRVKVSIAGIIISRSRDAMPYLERNRVGRDAIDSANALTDMGKYLYQERRLPTYDIAVAITKYDLCRRRKSGNCTTGTAGFAYVGGACVVNKRLQKVNSVAIVEDTGGFSGIIVAAHEVGHLLGAVHDGSGPPSYLGGPGARHCKWKDGFIMSDLRHTEKGFRWSPCSVEQFHHFLNGETATCLYNLPHEDESLPRVLPGKLLSLDAQCKKDRGTTACFKDERVCAQLFCFDSSSGFCVSYRPAAEGSDCGSGKICLNGKCAYDNENSISDIDIHRADDNVLNDTTLITNAKTTSTTTTSRTTTKRSSWWKNNNRWKKNKYSTTTTTASPFHSTKKPTTSHWPYVKNNYKTTTTTTTKKPDTTTRTTYTSKPSTKNYYSTKLRTTPENSRTTTNYYTTKRTTTSKPYTTKRTTPKYYTTKLVTPKPYTPKTTTTQRTTTTTTATTTTKKPTTIRTYHKQKDMKKQLNSIINDGSSDVDDGSCYDKLSTDSGSLSCSDFLKNYGDRYCNHRYIQKNCCKSKKELCATR